MAEALVTSFIVIATLIALAVGGEAETLMLRDGDLEKAISAQMFRDPPPALWCDREAEQ
jgi:hypothetical protein